MDILCLVIWVLNLVFAVMDVVNKKPINSVSGICAMLICVIYYLAKIMEATQTYYYHGSAGSRP